MAKLSEEPPPTQTPTPTATATPSTGSVSGKAYHDLNNNQVLDAGEPGVQGAPLVLKQGGVEKQAATSGASGDYSFPAVSPGQYTLIEKTAPPGYLLSTFSLLFQISANQAFSFDIHHRPGIRR